ncbi:hypothetical protein RclHR1_28160001 [Rhizophagus clarus]|uniref:BAH domain-containing protein n=1 Tax=Rhizophagus clarus TaxID=94130 RepID=A0A2Z6R3N4_9GLOM|nr:hypothetical protein RclHR1_28160001 [Rhizophagus clarus]
MATGRKMYSILYLKSDQGWDKGIITDFIQRYILGTQLIYKISDPQTILGSFNGQLLGKLGDAMKYPRVGEVFYAYLKVIADKYPDFNGNPPPMTASKQEHIVSTLLLLFQFIKETYIINDDYTTICLSVHILYAIYTSYCISRNITPLSKVVVARTLSSELNMTSNVIKINGKCIRIYNLSRKALYKKYLSNNWIHETDEIDIEEIDIPKKSVSDPKALDQFLAQIGIDISNKQKKSSPPVPSKSEQEKTEDQPVASESVENIIDNFITKLNTLISPLAKLEQEPEEWLDKHKYDYIKPWYKNSRDEMIDELYSTAKEYWVKYIDEDDPYNWDILLAELEEFDKIPYRDNLYLVKFGDAINKLKKWIKYNDNVDRQIKCLEFANYLKRYNENKETVFVEPPSCYKVAKLQPQIIECHSQINERECMEANGKEYESDYNDGLTNLLPQGKDDFVLNVYHATAGKIGRLLKLTFLETSSLKENESRSILRRIQESRINMAKNVIIACWVYVAKTMRMVFESKFTLDSYDELQKCLEEEMKILPKVFPEFANLPNLHINIHLLVHARTYGTLINTQVGIKEMVHRIFKAMVPRTNCKNVELDLLKRYTTLFAIRHLVDGGADQRLSQPCRGFATMSSNFRNLLTNWYITEDKVSNEQEPEENEEAISSPVDFITNIILKRSLSRQDRENIMKNLPNFKSELLLSFMDIGQKSALIYSQMGWYELATYTMEESDGVFSKVHLHIGDVVTIHEEDSGECYAIIKGIFKYKGNDDKYYAFITIDWFDNINRIHNVLKCPLFRIQTSQDIRWRRIFPISIIDHVQKVHFVYDTKIDLWIKNNYYFTAI